jgi:hypothetical protein
MTTAPLQKDECLPFTSTDTSQPGMSYTLRFTYEVLGNSHLMVALGLMRLGLFCRAQRMSGRVHDINFRYHLRERTSPYDTATDPGKEILPARCKTIDRSMFCSVVNTPWQSFLDRCPARAVISGKKDAAPLCMKVLLEGF